MIRLYFKQISILFKRLLLCFCIYFLVRLGFYFANQTAFPQTNFVDILRLSFFGLRFDAFSIALSCSVFIVLSLLPVNWFNHRTYQRILFWLYLIPNAVFTAFNCIDLAYFRFIKKRSDADIFNQLGGQSDMIKLIPRFLMDFWWAVLFYAVLLAVMINVYKKIKWKLEGNYKLQLSKDWALISLSLLISFGFVVLALRGGMQRVPISIVNAGSVSEPKEVPIVLNTPFTIIKSASDNSLSELNYYPPDQLYKIYSPYHHFKDLKPNKKNLVVLLLESFSKEYTKLSGKKSYTPFLDSLMDHSMVCTNAFANGNKSIEGIPAILASLPSFLDVPFINSRYANNEQSSFPRLLKNEGYYSAFLHGGINGTMNFDSWANLAGYDAFYGRNEYPDQKDFDGFWGIWDEPYLQYCSGMLSSFKQPFHAAIFTLSSHHPYLVPDKYKNKFPKSELENSESIGYADYALRRFFDSAKKTNWYQNTLFVLVADHSSISVDPFYMGWGGQVSIPILFFNPDNSLKSVHEETFSQIDILPSALELLGYNKPFFSLGKSFSSPRGHIASSNYYNVNFLQYTDSLACIYQGENLIYVYNYRLDSLCKQNILHKYPKIDSLRISEYKAFFQIYNHMLITNSAKPE
ncbi:MAG: LTA synthase family protein [Bacteroidia bacterium]|nr:LTA synthase family protein [Bacteroidia bacterium]